MLAILVKFHQSPNPWNSGPCLYCYWIPPSVMSKLVEAIQRREKEERSGEKEGEEREGREKKKGKNKTYFWGIGSDIFRFAWTWFLVRTKIILTSRNAERSKPQVFFWYTILKLKNALEKHGENLQAKDLGIEEGLHSLCTTLKNCQGKSTACAMMSQWRETNSKTRQRKAETQTAMLHRCSFPSSWHDV